MFRSTSSRVRRPAGSVLLVVGLIASAPASPAADEPRAGAWPSEVQAHYKITFNGFDLGSFRFQARTGDGGYALDGNAEISALLGAFTWQGITRASGKVEGSAPRPAGYSFAFRSSSKTGSVVLGFDKSGVKSVTALPPPEPDPDVVPVKDHHLKGAIDPLSAVMALTRSAGANPCDRRLQVFDGKQRFDLELSFRRQQRIVETRPSGQPDQGYVCGVRYVPIAGYKANAETEQMSKSAKIEVVMRAVPSANLHVPHQITIPTIAGLAMLTAERIEIKTGKSGDIALVN
jgi:hypothetical protein